MCGRPCWSKTCITCFVGHRFTKVGKLKSPKQYKKICGECEIEFYAFNKKTRFCSTKCHRKYYNTSPSNKLARRKWLKEHPEKIREYAKRCREKESETNRYS